MGERKFVILEEKKKIGLELEFYLTKNDEQIHDSNLVQSFIDDLLISTKKQKINLLAIEKEQGIGQIEIKTLPEIDLDKLSSDIELVKVISEDLAKNKYNLEADFGGTPFFDDCSNALQINLTILDKNNRNLFDKNDDQESKILLNSIAGLLFLLPKNIEFFAAKNSKRFDIARNQQLFLNKKYTSPVNLSWGYDNRSCAIRIIGKGNDRRLEFRVPDANINIKPAIDKFLEMVKYGIDNNLKAEEPIYGNAFNKQYSKLPTFL